MIFRNMMRAIFSLFGLSVRFAKNEVKLKRLESRRRWEKQWEFLGDYPVDTVLDIGANEGQFAQLIHGYLPYARIISFEPIADCFEKLQAVLKTIPGSKGYNMALGNTREEKLFFRSEFSPSSSLLEMSQEHKKSFPYTANHTEETIQVIPLDSLAGEIDLRGNVLVKIDVQGFEQMVLEGGRETIANSRYLLIEMSCYELYVGEPLFDVVYRMVTDLGFVYRGNIDQMRNTDDGRILSVDAFFEKIDVSRKYDVGSQVIVNGNNP